MTLSPEEELDVLRDAVETCADSFDKLAVQALRKADLLRALLADPESHSEEVPDGDD